MTSFYEIIIQAEVFHGFFPLEEGNVCTSLEFLPTVDCMRKLKEHRLIFKKTINGFVIVAEKKDVGLPNPVALIDIAAGTQFHFIITEIRNDFINITDTDPKLFSDGKKYVFRNTDLQTAVISGNLATIDVHNNTPIDDVLTLAPDVFVGPVAIAENPVKLVLKDVDGRFIIEKAVPRDSGGAISAERLLISDIPFAEGIYILQQVNAANVVTSSRKYFLSNSVTGQRVNGIFAINYNNILAAQAAKEIHLVILLSSRNIHWVYNIDIEKFEDPIEFTKRIKPADLDLDPTVSNPAIPSVFSKTVVLASANPADWFINDKVRFRSNSPVPLQKEAYEKIRLLNTNAGTNMGQPVIVNNLPNPDPLLIRETLPNTYEADMFLKVK